MRHRTFLTYANGDWVPCHYTEWGDPSSSRVVCCVHGLTRNARDFDALAQALSEDGRVACLDVVGRGESAWLGTATAYNYETYLHQIAAWLAHLRAESVVWVGTSMGGILGMMLAAAARTPVSRLVLSDVGARIPQAALQAIGQYLGKAPRFAHMAEAEQYLRQVHAGFGPLTDAQWRHLAEHSVRAESGGYRVRYDPAIAEVFGPVDNDVDLSPIWQQVACPVLILRGKASPLLLEDTAQRMAQRANVTLCEFADVGHAPMMMAADQIATVTRFIRGEAV